MTRVLEHCEELVEEGEDSRSCFHGLAGNVGLLEDS